VAESSTQTRGLVALAIVAYRLYERDWHLDVDTQREMQIVVASIVGIMTGTLAMVNLTAQPYLVDVGVGFATGYGTVLAAQHPRVSEWWADVVDDQYQRRAYVWFFLAVSAFALPTLVAVDGRGISLSPSRMYLTLVSAALAFYDVTLTEQQPSTSRPDATGGRS